MISGGSGSLSLPTPNVKTGDTCALACACLSELLMFSALTLFFEGNFEFIIYVAE
jgi:hypothetical protein